MLFRHPDRQGGHRGGIVPVERAIQGHQSISDGQAATHGVVEAGREEDLRHLRPTRLRAQDTAKWLRRA